MSFATYVSGTIHVRIAAQSGRESEAYKSLESCLDILSQQQSMFRAPRRARQILLGLARRLGIQIDDPSTSVRDMRVNADTNTDTPMHASTVQNPQSDFDVLMSGLDIDAIIQSFEFDESSMMDQVENMNYSFTGADAEDFSQWMLQDPLFGYDSLFPMDRSLV